MDTQVIPIPSDKAGCRLQVTANYTDRDGAQTAQSDKSGRITAPDPPPPTNTPGSLSLWPAPPKACGSLTATLTDPDVPLSDDDWWMGHVYATEGGEDSLGVERSLAELVAEGRIELEDVKGLNGTNLYKRFTVAGSQADARLRVRVTYDDGLADDQTASTLSNKVSPGKPKAPQNLTATTVSPGYSAIKLSWDAPSSTCGRSLEDYEYQQQKKGGDWSGWSSVGLTTSYTADNLASGSSYTFEVRAVNAVGEGASASTSGATRASDESEGEGETPPDEGEPPASAKPVLLGRSATPDSVLAAVSVPNPFNPSTILHVQLPRSGPVSLTLYNLSGQVVRRLMEGYQDAGVYAYEWDGRDAQGQAVGSGVYIYRLRASDQIFVGKVTLIR